MRVRAFGVELNVRRLRQKKKPISTFTAYLRAKGRPDLAPDDDHPRALANRVALLVRQNATPQQVQELTWLWEVWRSLPG